MRVEAMKCGLPTVTIFNKKFIITAFKNFLPPNYPFLAHTEKEIIKYSSELIQNLKLRKEIGNQLHNYFMDNLSTKQVRNSSSPSH